MNNTAIISISVCINKQTFDSQKLNPLHLWATYSWFLTRWFLSSFDIYLHEWHSSKYNSATILINYPNKHCIGLSMLKFVHYFSFFPPNLCKTNDLPPTSTASTSSPYYAANKAKALKQPTERWRCSVSQYYCNLNICHKVCLSPQSLPSAPLSPQEAHALLFFIHAPDSLRLSNLS